LISARSSSPSGCTGRATELQASGSSSGREVEVEVEVEVQVQVQVDSYLWAVAVTGLAAADTAVEAVGEGDAAGSRTSWSVAVLCSAMPKLRHQEGKHERARQKHEIRG
jgi:hypothetical protein